MTPLPEPSLPALEEQLLAAVRDALQPLGLVARVNEWRPYVGTARVGTSVVLLLEPASQPDCAFSEAQRRGHE